MNIPLRDLDELFLCEVQAVPRGEALRVDVAGWPPLAVFNLEGSFHVTDDTCTHGDASLSDGEIDGCEVECPFHAGAFNIVTGEPCGAPCSIALAVHPCVVRDGAVYLVV